MKETREELILREKLRESEDRQRDISSELYAAKWVERLFFWFICFVGAGFLSFLGYVIVTVIKSGLLK